MATFIAFCTAVFLGAWSVYFQKHMWWFSSSPILGHIIPIVLMIFAFIFLLTGAAFLG
jgi:hypothetical protein